MCEATGFEGVCCRVTSGPETSAKPLDTLSPHNQRVTHQTEVSPELPSIFSPPTLRLQRTRLPAWPGLHRLSWFLASLSHPSQWFSRTTSSGLRLTCQQRPKGRTAATSAAPPPPTGSHHSGGSHLPVPAAAAVSAPPNSKGHQSLLWGAPAATLARAVMPWPWC